jgi:hypothetical protein
MIEPVFGFEYPPQAGRCAFLSQLLYPEFAGAGPAIPARGRHQKNPLIRHWFDGTPAAAGRLLCIASFPKVNSRPEKIPLANFWFRITLQAGRSSSGLTKESQNGLESAEDRRSAGRHGNQHVCLRRPQVSGRDNFILD